MKKSHVDQFVLSFLFGPLGLFYSSTGAGIGFTITTLILIFATGGAIVLLAWPICILAGVSLVSTHNKKVAIEEARHKELVAATASAAPAPAPASPAAPPEKPSRPPQAVETIVTAQRGALTYRVYAYRPLSQEEAQQEVARALMAGTLAEPPPGGMATLVTEIGMEP